MNILLDMHTHTIASGHAYSTVQEVAHTAAEKGLKLLGITEHGYAMPGTCDPIYFLNLHAIPRNMYGVDLMMGAELNILDSEGNIDLEESYWRLMDLRIAGLHKLCYTPGSIEQNTDALLGAIRNPFVQIISHPGDGTADFLFEPVVLEAKKTRTILEINNSSLNPARHKKKAKPNNLEILRLCKQHEVPVILGSDAHISFSIGDYGYIYELLQIAEFPEQLIFNDKPDFFKSYLKKMP